MTKTTIEYCYCRLRKFTLWSVANGAPSAGFLEPFRETMNRRLPFQLGTELIGAQVRTEREFGRQHRLHLPKFSQNAHAMYVVCMHVGNCTAATAQLLTTSARNARQQPRTKENNSPPDSFHQRTCAVDGLSSSCGWRNVTHLLPSTGSVPSALLSKTTVVASFAGERQVQPALSHTAAVNH